MLKTQEAYDLMQSAQRELAMAQQHPKPPTIEGQRTQQTMQGIGNLVQRLSPGIQQQGQQMAMAQRRPPMQGQQMAMAQQGVSGMPARNMQGMARGGVVGFAGTEPVGSQVPPANTAQAMNTANLRNQNKALEYLAEQSMDAAIYTAAELQKLGQQIAALEGSGNPDKIFGLLTMEARKKAGGHFPEMNKNIEASKTEREEQLAIQAIRDEALRAGRERGEVVAAEREAKVTSDNYFNQPALAKEALDKRTQEIYKKLPFRGSRNDSDRRSEAKRLAEQELNFSSSRDKNAELEAYIRNSREVAAAKSEDQPRRNETQGLPALDMQGAPGSSGALPRPLVDSSPSGLEGILSGTEQRVVNSSQAQVNPQFQNVLTGMPGGGIAQFQTDTRSPQLAAFPQANGSEQTTSGIMPTAAPVREKTALELALEEQQTATLGRDATAEGIEAGNRFRELTNADGLRAERKALQGEARGLREERFSPERMKKRTLRAGLAGLAEKGLGGFGSGSTAEGDLIDSERAAAAGISLAEVEKMITENMALGMSQFEAENAMRAEVDGIISESGQITSNMLATDQRRETADLDRTATAASNLARNETMLEQARISARANQRVPTDTMAQLSIFTAQALRENPELSTGQAASAGLALYNAAQEELGQAKLGVSKEAAFLDLQSKALEMAIANIDGRNPPVRPSEYDALLSDLMKQYSDQFTLAGGAGSSTLPTITSQAAYDALTPGAYFLENGVQMQKPLP